MTYLYHVLPSKGPGSQARARAGPKERIAGAGLSKARLRTAKATMFDRRGVIRSGFEDRRLARRSCCSCSP